MDAPVSTPHRVRSGPAQYSAGPMDHSPGGAEPWQSSSGSQVPARGEIDRLRRRKIQPEADRLRDRWTAWAAANVAHLEEAEPELHDELSDRAREVWEPLLAIADLAGDEWAKRARRAARELFAALNRPAAARRRPGRPRRPRTRRPRRRRARSGHPVGRARRRARRDRGRAVGGVGQGRQADHGHSGRADTQALRHQARPVQDRRQQDPRVPAVRLRGRVASAPPTVRIGPRVPSTRKKRYRRQSGTAQYQ